MSGKCKELTAQPEVIDALNADGLTRELDLDTANTVVSVCFVPNRYDGFIPLRNVRLGHVFTYFLSTTVEQDEKSKNGLIWGDCYTERMDVNVTTMAAFVYEFDNTASDEEVRACLDRAGVSAIAYNTFNHDQDGATKIRVVLFCSECIPLAEVGQDGWRALWSQVGKNIFGELKFDPANKNPSRIHWNPARPSGSDRGHRVSVHHGLMLDWRTTWSTVAAEVMGRRQKVKSAYAKRALLRTVSKADSTLREIEACLDCIPASIPYPDWFRVLGAIHHETGGSLAGLHLAHSWSSGDERYRSEQVDAIWHFFEPNHANPSTIATLVMLARQHNPNFQPHRSIRKGFELLERMIDGVQP